MLPQGSNTALGDLDGFLAKFTADGVPLWYQHVRAEESD